MKPTTWTLTPRSIAMVAALMVLAGGVWIALRSARPWPANSSGWTVCDWHQYLAAQRRTQIERLRAYIDRGEFPRNLHRPFGPIPYFVDVDGTRCAVGHLMDMDGWRRDVEAIARANNHVYVADVTSGPLVDWIRTSGLTQEECARIQPSYNFEPYRPGDQLPEFEVQGERERIRAHLLQVEGELVRDTVASLTVALDRLLGTLPRPAGIRTAGFIVDAPVPAGGWRKVENRSAAIARVRVMEVGADGLKRHGSDWVTIPPRGTAVSEPKAPGSTYVLEWNYVGAVPEQAPVAVVRENAR